MLTKKQLEDAVKCSKGILCSRCEMQYNGGFSTDCVRDIAQTALEYREALEKAREAFEKISDNLDCMLPCEGYWENEHGKVAQDTVKEAIEAIDQLLKEE